MASQMLKAKDESMSGTKQFHQQMKRITAQIHCSKSPSKSASPSRIKNVDILDKVGALKTEKLPRQTAKDREGGIKKNSVISPLGTPQKPWPGRKVTEMDETVKNMSNVPFYLQRLEKGDSIHEKALDVGVMEWGVLERWTHLQKCSSDARGSDSSSSCTESTMFSTFGFSNQSHGTVASPLYQGKKSSVLARKKLSFSGSPAMMREEEVYRPIEVLPSQRDNHLDVVFDPLGYRNDKDISTCLDSEGMPDELCLGSHSTTSPSRENTDQATVISIGEDHDYSSTNIIPLANDTMPLFDDNEEIWDFLQHSADGRQLCSGSTIATDCWQSESNSKNHSGNMVEDFEIIYRFSEVPHSCPLPLPNLNGEPDVPCDVPSVGVAPADKPVQGNGGIPSTSCEALESYTTQKPREFDAKAIDSEGKKLTIYPSSTRVNRMSRSSSLKAGSSEELFESISFLYNSHGEQVTRNSKGRQSPLRRLLDPIMKPKNNLHSAGKVAALPGHHSSELRTDKSSRGVNKPLNITFDSVCQTRESVITLKELPYNGKGTQNDNKHATMMKHALFHLAQKNGLPLFMFSSCDGEVLAAAKAMTSTSNIDNLECMFRIFSMNGSKKKNTFWHNSGNKCKQHQSISNVVGQLNVALSEAKSFPYGSFDSVREFVLLDASKSVDSPAVSELAAMVVQIPPSRKPNLWTMSHHSNYGGPLSTNSSGNLSAAYGRKSLHSDQHNVICQSSMSVIIPSGIHGLARNREPSRLIERWRSGGVCDCGGWDEGCTLNVLSNNFQEHNSCGSFQPPQTTDGTHRFKLFTQGASRQTRHAFSMVSVKEGLYTVDFQSSISLLQAFAICLAVIHGKKPCICSTQRKKLQEHIVNDQFGKSSTSQAGNPNSYLPNHLPVSPVGRT